MKVGVERRSSVTFSPLWGGDTHLFLLFDSIHSLLGLFAKLTWGCVLSFPNQSPDFALESFLFFSVFYPPWDEAFVDSLCIRKNGDVKKKRRMEVSAIGRRAWTSFKHSQTLSHSGFLTPGYFTRFGALMPLALSLSLVPGILRHCLLDHLLRLALHSCQSVSRPVVSDFCSPVDYSPPGSSIPGILQVRTLEWVAISYSRGSY